MELTMICIVAVLCSVAVASLAKRIGVASPLILAVVGVGLSFLPGLEEVEVDPEWVLAGVLPPLLYAAAVHMPATDFRRDLKAIGGLAVMLVVLTTLCAGWLVNAMVPGVGLAAAFALGAVISPTDAVAATSVGKRLGLPSRLLTILEGEGLVNDASSLVLLSSAVAAMSTSVALWSVGLKFAFAVVAAIVIGSLVGWASVRVRAMLNDSVLTTAITFVVPFVAYVPAEEMHASGVLAVVIAGLVAGHQAPRLLPARDRFAESVNWETVAFLLESGAFLFMGLQLKSLLDEADRAGLSSARAVGVGLLVSLLVIVLRMLFVAPLVASMRRDADRAASLRPILEKMEYNPGRPGREERNRKRFEEHVQRKKNDVDFFVAQSFGWRGGVVLAWSGMRGAITVAAAQTLPSDTPYRAQLLLIAFVVAGTTLLLQGLTLPRVIRMVGVPGDDPAADREEYGLLVDDLASSAADLLDDPALERPGGGRYEPEVVDRVRADTRAGHRSSGSPDRAETDLQDQYGDLMLAVLRTGRRRLLDVRDEGLYSSRVLTRAQRALDLQEAGLQRTAGSASG